MDKVSLCLISFVTGMWITSALHTVGLSFIAILFQITVAIYAVVWIYRHS